MSAPGRAFSGPRALNETGSADWCWQTVDLLKRYFYNIEQTWQQADEVVGELKQVEAWKVLPSPEEPYGTFNKMCLEVLGMKAREVARSIDREKIKALGPALGGRPSLENGSGTNVFRTGKNTADHYVARLKRDDPDLAERVIRGEVTANAAAREKGWRKPRIVLSSPERVAESLRNHMSADDIARLIAALLGKDATYPPTRDGTK